MLSSVLLRNLWLLCFSFILLDHLHFFTCKKDTNNISNQHTTKTNIAIYKSFGKVKINTYTNSMPTFKTTFTQSGALGFYNRRFPEITGKDNLTVFSYSGRVKSPEWRRQLRRADLRQFQILSYGPIIIYTRLPAGGTLLPICTFPTNSERLIGISDAFFAFCLRVSVILPTCSLYPQQKRAYSALHPQVWTYI